MWWMMMDMGERVAWLFSWIITVSDTIRKAPLAEAQIALVKQTRSSADAESSPDASCHLLKVIRNDTLEWGVCTGVTLISVLGIVQGHWKKSLKMVPFESLDKVSYSYSIVTMAVYPILFLRYSEILVENRYFYILLAFDAPVRGVPVGKLVLKKN